MPIDLYHQLAKSRTEKPHEYLCQPCMHRCALGRCRVKNRSGHPACDTLAGTVPVKSANFDAKLGWVSTQFSHALSTTTLKKNTTGLDYTTVYNITQKRHVRRFKTTNCKHLFCDPTEHSLFRLIHGVNRENSSLKSKPQASGSFAGLCSKTIVVFLRLFSLITSTHL